MAAPPGPTASFSTERLAKRTALFFFPRRPVGRAITAGTSSSSHSSSGQKNVIRRAACRRPRGGFDRHRETDARETAAARVEHRGDDAHDFAEAFRSGPPELPGFTAASNWMRSESTRSPVGERYSRLRPDTRLRSPTARCRREPDGNHVLPGRRSARGRTAAAARSSGTVSAWRTARSFSGC